MCTISCHPGTRVLCGSKDLCIPPTSCIGPSPQRARLRMTTTDYRISSTAIRSKRHPQGRFWRDFFSHRLLQGIITRRIVREIEKVTTSERRTRSRSDFVRSRSIPTPTYLAGSRDSSLRSERQLRGACGRLGSHYFLNRSSRLPGLCLGIDEGLSASWTILVAYLFRSVIYKRPARERKQSTIAPRA